MANYFMVVVRGVIGLVLLNTIIFIHEAGHFLTALFFGVPTPFFSLGFGPVLFSLPTQWTTFQLAVLPLGGYVSLDPTQLELQTYGTKLIIMLAGIGMNLVSAYSFLVLMFWNEYGISALKKSFQEIGAVAKGLRSIPSQFFKDKEKRPVIIGPIGIINLMGSSVFMGLHQCLYLLAFLSINIALFNCLPLPFLDGGHVWRYTVQEVVHRFGVETGYLFVVLVLLAVIVWIIHKMAAKK